MSTSYDPRFVDFIRNFNIEQDFYECHEVMEDLWLDEGRDRFYQGLLQAAVALHHFSYGNVSGAKKLFYGAIEKLGKHKERQCGIDLLALIEHCQTYVERLEDIHSNPFPYEPFQINITDDGLALAVQSKRQL